VRRSITESNGFGGSDERRASLNVPVVDRESLQKRRSQRASPLGAVIQRFALSFIAVALFGIILYQTRSLMVPIVAAIVVGMTIGPYADYAERHGIPPAAIYGAILLAACIIPYLTIISLSGPVSSWIARGPEVGALLEGKLQVLERPLAAWREIKDALQKLGGAEGPEIHVATTLNDFVTTLMAFLTPALGQLLVFLGALIFFLTGRRQLKQRLTLSFADRRARLTTLKVISDIEGSLTTYLTTSTLINLGVGIATGIAAALVGVANPVMWGITAFVCNFIPYAGPTALMIIFVFVGLLTFNDVWTALVLPLLYLLIVTVETQFVTPTVMSRRLEMNSFLVFVGLVFWSWMWGLAGAFLAVPLLIAASAVARHLQPSRGKEGLP
jgi:predicted PurR-regulated permease PerM